MSAISIGIAQSVLGLVRVAGRLRDSGGKSCRKHRPYGPRRRIDPERRVETGSVIGEAAYQIDVLEEHPDRWRGFSYTYAVWAKGGLISFVTRWGSVVRRHGGKSMMTEMPAGKSWYPLDQKPLANHAVETAALCNTVGTPLKVYPGSTWV